MRILITGITGRIGVHLAEALIADGHQVRGLVWTADPGVAKLEGLPIDLVEGSLTVTEDVCQAMKGIEVVCHLGAAFQAGGPFSNHDYFQINVAGTFNMLEAASQQRVEHFFFASTDAVYSKYPAGGLTEPICEDVMPKTPGGWYALSKVLGEEMCLGYLRSQRLPVTIFRFALVVATDEILDFRQFYLSHWQETYENRTTEAAVETRQQLFDHQAEKLVIARDENGRSYQKHILDVRDIVQAFRLAISNPQTVGEVIQLAAPEPFVWETTIPYLARALEMEYIDLRLRGQSPTFYQFDLSKCRERIGYQPQFDIFKTIDSALDYRSRVQVGSSELI